MTLEIKTNNHVRPFVNGFELLNDKKVRQQFDFLSDEEFSDQQFVSYKGYWYGLCDFLRPNDCFRGWDGYAADSYFSGVLIKIVEDGEAAVLATYTS